MSRPGSGGGGSGKFDDGRYRNPPYTFLTSSMRPVGVQPPIDDYDADDVILGGFVSAESGVDVRPTPRVTPPTMSMAVLMLIIVASLSAVVGAIYLLIYFKSIKPMSARSRSYADPGGGKGDDDGGARKSAGHPFFRRK